MKEIKAKVKSCHATFKLTTYSIVRFSPQTKHFQNTPNLVTTWNLTKLDLDLFDYTKTRLYLQKKKIGPNKIVCKKSTILDKTFAEFHVFAQLLFTTSETEPDFYELFHKFPNLESKEIKK